MGERLSGIYYFMSGAIMLGSWVAALFFFRFWRKSRDRFFIFFAVSFLVFGTERVATLLNGDPNSESNAMFYVMRLSGFLVIVWAILEKNLRRDA